MDMFGRTACILLVAGLLFFLSSQYFRRSQRDLTNQMIQQEFENFYERIRVERKLTLQQYNTFIDYLWAAGGEPKINIETGSCYLVQEGLEEYLGWDIINSEDIHLELYKEGKFFISAGDILSLTLVLGEQEFHLGGMIFNK